jgi:hypothetical protein
MRQLTDETAEELKSFIRSLMDNSYQCEFCRAHASIFDGTIYHKEDCDGMRFTKALDDGT